MNLFENVFLQQQFWHRAHLMGNLVWNEECGIAALDINGNVFILHQIERIGIEMK